MGSRFASCHIQGCGPMVIILTKISSIFKFSWKIHITTKETNPENIIIDFQIVTRIIQSSRSSQNLPKSLKSSIWLYFYEGFHIFINIKIFLIMLLWKLYFHNIPPNIFQQKPKIRRKKILKLEQDFLRQQIMGINDIHFQHHSITIELTFSAGIIVINNR